MLEDKQAMTDITRTGNCACTEAYYTINYVTDLNNLNIQARIIE